MSSKSDVDTEFLEEYSEFWVSENEKVADENQRGNL